MNRFIKTYLKISFIIYCLLLLIGTMVWLAARFFFGIVPTVVYSAPEQSTVTILVLIAVVGIILTQLLAWAISHIIHKVISVRG